MKRIQIGKYLLIGGGMCPEQYDVFDGDTEVGYLRLRHGSFRAETLFNNKVVYTAKPSGDGCFNADEREKYLTDAVRAIDEELSRDVLKHSH